MAVVGVVWVSLFQIANLSLCMQASSFSDNIATNNQTLSFGADPLASMGPSILDDDNNKTLRAPPRASTNVTTNTRIGEEPNSFCWFAPRLDAIGPALTHGKTNRRSSTFV